MRKGKVVSVSNTKEEKIESLANKMVGENLSTIKKKINNFKNSEEILKISNLNFTSDDPYETNLTNLNFSLKKGECLGIAGISGNGQSELFQILSGEIITENTFL